jgi:hypothetical protein
MFSEEDDTKDGDKNDTELTPTHALTIAKFFRQKLKVVRTCRPSLAAVEQTIPLDWGRCSGWY